MSFDYIERTYGVKAKRGQRVVAYGKPGVVTGTEGQYLTIRLDGQKHSNPYHPTDGLVWPESEPKTAPQASDSPQAKTEGK